MSYFTKLLLRLLCLVVKISSKHSHKIGSGSSMCFAVCHSKLRMLLWICQKFGEELQQRFSSIYDGNCKRNGQSHYCKCAKHGQTVLLPLAYKNTNKHTDDEVVEVAWEIPGMDHTLKSDVNGCVS